MVGTVGVEVFEAFEQARLYAAPELFLHLFVGIGMAETLDDLLRRGTGNGFCLSCFHVVCLVNGQKFPWRLPEGSCFRYSAKRGDRSQESATAGVRRSGRGRANAHSGGEIRRIQYIVIRYDSNWHRK